MSRGTRQVTSVYDYTCTQCTDLSVFSRQDTMPASKTGSSAGNSVVAQLNEDVSHLFNFTLITNNNSIKKC